MDLFSKLVGIWCACLSALLLLLLYVHKSATQGPSWFWLLVFRLYTIYIRTREGKEKEREGSLYVMYTVDYCCE